jgi:hypothetical protein
MVLLNLSARARAFVFPRARRARPTAALASWLTLCALAACSRERAPAGTNAPPIASNAPPVAPLPRKPAETAYGIELPRTIEVTRRFTDSIYMSTQLPLEKAESVFRDHVLVQHVEVSSKRTTFPRVFVKGASDQRIYRIELTKFRSGTQIRMKDITPPPVTQGLTEAERWREAGRNLDGSVVNQLERF